MKRISRIAVVLGLISGCHGGGPQPPGPISVSVSPGTASIDIGGTQQFTASVTGAQTAVNWTLSGPGCANGACGWIDATGVYSAPDDPPNPPVVTVTATAQADEAKSGSANVTITTRSNERFSGRYALLFNGFELDNIAVAIAGSFTVDGYGTVTGGMLDTNRSAGIQIVPITGGSYSFGADNRGRLNLNTAGGVLVFRFAMSAPNPPNYTGRLICFQPGDVSRITGSGVIKKQNREAFSLAAFRGDFSAGFLGELASRSPVGAVGKFTLDGVGGTIRNGLLDVNLTGTPYSSAPSSGIYGPISDVTGRGTARLRFPDPMGDLNFSFYVVSDSEAFFLGNDARAANVPLFSGPVLKRSQQPFTPASLAGPLAFSATGLTASGSDVTIGRIDAHPGPNNLSGILDKNAAGTITSAAFTGAYDIAPTGRGTLNFNAGPMTGSYVFYMVNQNKAFLLQSEAVEAGSGWIEAQTGGPFTTSSVSGNYVVGTQTPAECGCTSTSGVVTLNGANGTFLGARDKSKPEGLIPRDVWAGTFEVAAGMDGRGVLTTTLPFAETSALYVISPNKLMLINADSGFQVSAVTILEK